MSVHFVGKQSKPSSPWSIVPEGRGILPLKAILAAEGQETKTGREKRQPGGVSWKPLEIESSRGEAINTSPRSNEKPVR